MNFSSAMPAVETPASSRTSRGDVGVRSVFIAAVPYSEAKEDGGVKVVCTKPFQWCFPQVGSLRIVHSMRWISVMACAQLAARESRMACPCSAVASVGSPITPLGPKS
ncbi:hypothetical protein D3C80_1943040 [compost metagenome]